MKKIRLFMSLLLLCAAASFAQEENKNVLQPVKCSDLIIMKAMAKRGIYWDYEKMAPAVMNDKIMKVYSLEDLIKKPLSKKEIQKEQELREKRKAAFKEKVNSARDDINAGINEAFADFTRKNKNHEQEYYKLLANHLIETAGDDIVNGGVSFMDGAEFGKTFPEYKVYDNYKGTFNSEKKDHKTNKVISQIRLAMLVNGGPALSVSFIQLESLVTIPNVDFVYTHKWDIDAKNKTLTSFNISPDDDSALRDSLIKAGAPVRSGNVPNAAYK